MRARPSFPDRLYYLSHHKCATMYANSILGRVATEIGLAKRTLYGPEDFGGDLREFVDRSDARLVCYLDATWEHVRDLGPIRGVHVIRDPRDILVSAYFSHLHSHQTETWEKLREHRERLRDVPKEEGLHLEMEFTGYVFKAMEQWDYNREGMLELRFEQLADRPYQFWLRTVSHLGFLDASDFGLRRNLSYILRGLLNQAQSKYGWWPFGLHSPRIPAQRLLGIAFENRFEKKSGGRDPGDSDPKSHYRKGQPGDWKNHLTEKHLEAFDRKFPRLLAKTGYAQSAKPAGVER